MRPHHAYRVATALIPLGVLLIVGGALLGNWLGVANGALAVEAKRREQR
jgi:uncharacterized membrane protein